MPSRRGNSGGGWSDLTAARVKSTPLPRMIKCTKCGKNKSAEAFSNKQLNQVRASVAKFGQGASIPGVRCTACTPGAQEQGTCVMCHKIKPLLEFSKRQRGEGDQKKCEECMEEHLVLADVPMEHEVNSVPPSIEDGSETDEDSSYKTGLSSRLGTLEISSNYTGESKDTTSKPSGIRLPVDLQSFLESDELFESSTSKSKASRRGLMIGFSNASKAPPHATSSSAYDPYDAPSQADDDAINRATAAMLQAAPVPPPSGASRSKFARVKAAKPVRSGKSGFSDDEKSDHGDWSTVDSDSEDDELP
ncbi:hypothetical protein P152DRAFT_209595 [Eremomyces bilateralis CBS 781.70]|uniref:Stc1 domain-containing protein n=1 Tax=Eremomyces bilateralis CBS 781.70 TaxID=1392243 RepID=A0A6G1FSU7_9PEZI|nr:uncharacterized protein P152DRAFT_209595 [Eremomyces bilateralis CBS 781.70]KAF1808788.1 hypothetical protein P152DRAFT_209595 [Eremomyces bilateralis CBS 781.70]